jgi:hypothetical protein
MSADWWIVNALACGFTARIVQVLCKDVIRAFSPSSKRSEGQ